MCDKCYAFVGEISFSYMSVLHLWVCAKCNALVGEISFSCTSVWVCECFYTEASYYYYLFVWWARALGQ